VKKRLQIYIGVVVFMIVAIIISAIFENPYRVYLASNTDIESVFKAKTATVDKLKKSVKSSSEPLPLRELMLDSNAVALRYSETLSNEMYAYTTADSKVVCWYSIDSDKLRLMSAEGWFLADDEADESDYLNWIYKQVGNYYAENWDDYVCTCSTTILSTASGAPQQIERDGFQASAGKQETISAYVFTFTKYLGQNETTDIIQAYIRPGNGFAALEFSAHNFDEAEPVEIRTDRLDDAVKSFLRRSVDKTKYTYISQELSQPKITYIGKKLCCVCNATIHLEASGETVTVQQQLIITL